MEQLRDVSNILWRERNLLELLAFKLDAERLLARAGRTPVCSSVRLKGRGRTGRRVATTVIGTTVWRAQQAQS